MSEAATTVSVLLADDAAVVRNSIKHLLGAESNIDVLSEAESIEETISLAMALKPDVILLDLNMSEPDKVNTAFIKNQFVHCGSRVLAMTIGDVEAEEIKRLAESIGAVVLLDKANLCYELVSAILGQKRLTASPD
jgi:two-component system nitrate/nitrite response regulator NarL